MNDRCPFCGHAKANEGSEVYQCGTRRNEPEKLVRTHNCYNREIAKLRAVVEEVIEIQERFFGRSTDLHLAMIGWALRAKEAAGYLKGGGDE